VTNDLYDPNFRHGRHFCLPCRLFFRRKSPSDKGLESLGQALGIVAFRNAVVDGFQKAAGEVGFGGVGGGGVLHSAKISVNVCYLGLTPKLVTARSGMFGGAERRSSGREFWQWTEGNLTC